jgi:hypothetical protein
METPDLMRLTDVETLIKHYREVLGERIHTDGTHPLYNKGVFDGITIMVAAMSESIKARKKIEDQTDS